MPTSYEHIQKGGKWLYFLAIPVGFEFIFIAVLVSILNAHDEHPMPREQLIFILGLIGIIPATIMTWVFLMMSALTVSIDQTFVRIRFGGGMWRKKFSLDKVQSVTPVRNSWWMGFGIHWAGNGWLYNIAGMEAVEITLKNGKKARIGTDEPGKLAAAIESALKK